MASYPSYPAQTPSDAAPRKSNKGRIILFVVLGLLVVLLALGGAAYALAGRFLSAQRNTPALLPADTQFYASINPNLSAFAGAKRLQDAYLQTDPEATEDFNKQLQDQFGVTFKDDIQPWVGLEMAIAVSGIDNLNQDVSDPSAVAQEADATILIASRDNAKAQEFLNKVRAKAEADEGQKFTEEDYKGTKITVNETDTDGELKGAYAIVQNNVVLASSAQLIKNMIDRSGSTQNTLAESADYKATIAGLPTDGVGYVYVAGDLLRKATEQSANQLNELGADSDALKAQLDLQREIVGAFQGLGAALTLPEDGVQLDTAVKFDMSKLGDKAKQQFEATRVQVSDALLNGVAKNALAVYALPIPDTFRTQIEEFIKSLPDAEEQIQSFEQQFNLDLEQDVLSWISGEMAVVVMPGEKSTDGSLSDVPVSGYLVLRSKDKAAAEQGLGKIADALSSAAGIQFTETDLGGAKWQAVNDPSTDSALGGYAFINDAVVFGFAEPAMTAAGGASSDPIANDATFKAAQGKAYSPSGALAYVDVQDAINTAVEFQGQTRAEFDETDGGKALKPIQSMIISGEPGVNAEGLGRARFFMAVTPQQ